MSEAIQRGCSIPGHPVCQFFSFKVWCMHAMHAMHRGSVLLPTGSIHLSRPSSWEVGVSCQKLNGGWLLVLQRDGSIGRRYRDVPPSGDESFTQPSSIHYPEIPTNERSGDGEVGGFSNDGMMTWTSPAMPTWLPRRTPLFLLLCKHAMSTEGFTSETKTTNDHDVGTPVK